MDGLSDYFFMKKVTMFRVLVRTTILVIVTLSCSSCSYLQGKASDTERTYFRHVVRYPGETMGAISRWYTGETRNWKIIAQLNKSVSPKRISIGDEILIPDELVITGDPLPRKSLKRRRTRRIKKRPAKVSNSSPKTESVQNLKPSLKPSKASVDEAMPTPIQQPGFADDKSEISAEREQLLDELLR